MRRVTIAFFLTFLGTQCLEAQIKLGLKKYAQNVSFSYKAGFLVAHRESMAHLPMSHFHSYELSYNFQSRGHQAWEQAHRYPHLGAVGLVLLNANREVLGNAYGLAGRVTMPKRKWGKDQRWSWGNNIAFGLGYLEKRFHLTQNPKNIAIGTHVNLLIMLGTSVQFQQKNQIYSIGFDFTHFSNGGTRKPNLGLNIPSLKLGASWMTKNQNFNEEKLDFKRNDLELLITGIVSAKNNYDFQNQVFPVFAASAHLSKARGKNYRYLYGLDLLYSEANRHFLASDPDQSFLKTVQVGVYNSWELDLERFVFSVGMGINAYNPLDPFGWFYHRIGGRIYIKRNLFFHGFVRSHWAKADFFETGISYRIPVR